MKNKFKGKFPRGLSIRLHEKNLRGDEYVDVHGLIKIRLVSAKGKTAILKFDLDDPDAGKAWLICPDKQICARVLRIGFKDRIELLGGLVKIYSLQVQRGEVQLKFDAPREIKIMRSVLATKIANENEINRSNGHESAISAQA